MTKKQIHHFLKWTAKSLSRLCRFGKLNKKFPSVSDWFSRSDIAGAKMIFFFTASIQNINIPAWHFRFLPDPPPNFNLWTTTCHQFFYPKFIFWTVMFFKDMFISFLLLLSKLVCGEESRFYSLSANDIGMNEVKMSDFRGKVYSYIVLFWNYKLFYSQANLQSGDCYYNIFY